MEGGGERENFGPYTFIIKNKNWYVVSPFVTLHSEIKTDLLPQAISTNYYRNLGLGTTSTLILCFSG